MIPLLPKDAADILGLELRKNRRNLLGITALFFASLPLEAIATKALAGYPFPVGMELARRLWVLAGLPGMAVLLGASAGAALRRASRPADEVLPVSPYRRAWAALAAAALQEGALAALFLLAGALIPAPHDAAVSALTLLPSLGGGGPAAAMLLLVLCGLASSFVCAYAVDHGVLGGLLGLGLTMVPASRVFSAVRLEYLISMDMAGLAAHGHSRLFLSLLPALVLSGAGFAFALNWTVTWVERRSGGGWLRAAAIVLALSTGPFLTWRGAGYALREALVEAVNHPSGETNGKFREAMEQAVRLRDFAAEKDPLKRFYGLNDALRIVLEQGKTEEARAYSREFLAAAPKFKGNWNYGNAVFDGNLVLGKLALAAGDIPEAKKRLLEAGKTPGSPQLSSFGPDMSLAEALLKKGERKTVEEFLKECRAFWTDGTAHLDRYEQRVREGKTGLREGD